MQRQFKTELLVTLEIDDNTPMAPLKQQVANATIQDIIRTVEAIFPTFPPGFARLSGKVTSMAEVFQAGRSNHKDRDLPITEN
jgi:hypothetical protein